MSKLNFYYSSLNVSPDFYHSRNLKNRVIDQIHFVKPVINNVMFYELWSRYNIASNVSINLGPKLMNKSNCIGENLMNILFEKIGMNEFMNILPTDLRLPQLIAAVPLTIDFIEATCLNFISMPFHQGCKHFTKV